MFAVMKAITQTHVQVILSLIVQIVITRKKSNLVRS
jgi:hypothetical protein